MILYIIIYVVGYFLTILFFKKFGKKIGLDYSGPRTYANYDDWGSNAEAYTFFSVFWPIVMSVLSIFGIIKLLQMLTNKIIK